MLDEKTYKIKVIGSFTGESSEKKTPFFGLELETACGEFIDFIQYITDNNAKTALKQLTNAGFIGKKISDLSNPKIDMDDLFVENEKMTAVVEHEEWTDEETGEVKSRAVVRWINNGTSGPEKADHKQAVSIFKGRSFDGMLKEMQSKVKPKKEKTTEEVIEASNEELENDDVPF